MNNQTLYALYAKAPTGTLVPIGRRSNVDEALRLERETIESAKGASGRAPSLKRFVEEWAGDEMKKQRPGW